MAESSPENSTALDQSQVALLSLILERLIPTDGHGPGAREAHAVRYILIALESDYRRYLADYVAGLASIDARARGAFRLPFVALETARQDAIFAGFDRRDSTKDPPTPRSFFDLVLKHTREGVFGNPCWGGKADRVGWNMIGYGGPRLVWAAEEQQIERIA